MDGLLRRAFFFLFAISLGLMAISCDPQPGPEKPPTPPASDPDPGGPIVMSSEGAVLSKKDIQYAIYSAIDWNAISADSKITGLLEGGAQNLRELRFDPETSKIDLEKMGFDMRTSVTLLYPEGDDHLAKAAEIISANLKDIGMEVFPTSVPAAELQSIMQARLAAGEEVLALSR